MRNSVEIPKLVIKVEKNRKSPQRGENHLEPYQNLYQKKALLILYLENYARPLLKVAEKDQSANQSGKLLQK